MRKLIYTTLGPALLALALITMATPGKADVSVIVEFTKSVDIIVNELIEKEKNVFIDVVAEFDLDGAAEAQAVVNATNDNNSVDGSGDFTGNDEADFEIFLTAIIDNSINDNSGIVGVNQENGNMINQGNVVSLSVTGRAGGTEEIPTAESSIAHSQAEVEQLNFANTVFDSEFLPESTNGPNFTEPNKVAGIRDSVNNNAGIVGVNQGNGNMANQHNVVSMAIGFFAAVALSEAALGQENSGNTVTEIETVKRAVILRSVNGNSGIVSLNQDNGNMNNQAHVVSFSALTSNIEIGVPGS